MVARKKGKGLVQVLLQPGILSLHFQFYKFQDQGTKMPRKFHANFKPEVRQSIDPGFEVHGQSKKDIYEDFDWGMDDDEMKTNPQLGSPHHPKWNSLRIKKSYANLFPQENHKNEAFGGIDFGQQYAVMNGDEGKATKRNQV